MNYYSALLDDEGAAGTDNSSPEDENTTWTPEIQEKS
jgi:hypothetical protein